MLLDYLTKLNAKRIVLASASPRRSEILKTVVGLDVEVRPSTFEENLDKSQFAAEADYAVETARQKAIDVLAKVQGDSEKPLIVIGSDTIVVRNGVIMEKPKSEEDAVSMLKALSGSGNTVYSGVAIAYLDSTGISTRTFYEKTNVLFADIPDEVINAYVQTKEPMDKAGAYGIQTLGGSMVRSIEGCYFNVMGFPAHRFAQEVRSMLMDGTICL